MCCLSHPEHHARNRTSLADLEQDLLFLVHPISTSVLWDKTRSFWDNSFTFLQAGSERASTWMCVVERTRKASRAEQGNERAMRADEHMDRRGAQNLRLNSWLFWTTVHAAITSLRMSSISPRFIYSMIVLSIDYPSNYVCSLIKMQLCWQRKSLIDQKRNFEMYGN